MAIDMLGHFIGRKPATIPVFTHITLLLTGIIGRLALVEVRPSSIAFPQCLVALEVLIEECVHGHFITHDM